MTTPCESKGEIDKLTIAIYGNGKPGLKTEIEVIKFEVREIKDSIDSMATSLASLAKSQVEYDVTEKLKIQLQAKRTDAIKLVAIVFGVAIPLTALIIQIV